MHRLPPPDRCLTSRRYLPQILLIHWSRVSKTGLKPRTRVMTLFDATGRGDLWNHRPGSTHFSPSRLSSTFISTKSFAGQIRFLAAAQNSAAVGPNNPATDEPLSTTGLDSLSSLEIFTALGCDSTMHFHNEREITCQDNCRRASSTRSLCSAFGSATTSDFDSGICLSAGRTTRSGDEVPARPHLAPDGKSQLPREC